MRAIGALSATAIVAGAMLGVGIFLTPHLVAQSVTSPTLFLLLWGLGGLIAIAGAVTYGELGAMMPDAGGEYVYLGRAFGSAMSFAAGTVLFIGVFGGSIASMSAAISQYQLSLLAGSVGIDLSNEWVVLPALGVRITGVEFVAVGLVLAIDQGNPLCRCPEPLCRPFWRPFRRKGALGGRISDGRHTVGIPFFPPSPLSLSLSLGGGGGGCSALGAP